MTATAATSPASSARTKGALSGLGAIVLLLGGWRLNEGGVAGVPLIIIGCGVMLIAAFFDRIKSWKVGPSGFAGELYERAHGVELVQAAARAGDSALAAVMPLLREDVASGVVIVPSHYDGKRLVDPELHFLRQELNVTVFALRRPGDQKWCGGGRVSTTVLAAGTELAVAGEPADITHLRRRFAG